MERTCSINGCDGKHQARGYCRNHYQRARRAGMGTLPHVDGCSVEGCEGSHRSRGYCSLHYGRWLAHGDPLVIAIAPRDDDGDARLRHHGWTVTESGCWEWNGGKSTSGYGKVRFRGRTVPAHRLAYETWVGPIPEGLIVRHVVCDNPPCLRPDHLEVGTQQDNTNDMMSKGRWAGGRPKK